MENGRWPEHRADKSRGGIAGVVGEVETRYSSSELLVLRLGDVVPLLSDVFCVPI